LPPATGEHGNGDSPVRHVLLFGDVALCGSDAGEVPNGRWCDVCLDCAAEILAMKT
jgi:hypothetical protein